jgi:hypothetical protein
MRNGLAFRSWWQRMLGAGTAISASVSSNVANEPMVARDETMFGIPVDTLMIWANVVSLSGVIVAAAGIILANQLSARVTTANSQELQHVQSEARTQIETLRTAASRANARAADLVRANTELQIQLQTEKEARANLPEYIQTRNMTTEQMATFVEAIKGKVRRVSLFTVPDREASIFGITVLDALRKADVSVTWYRLQSPLIPGPGITGTGVLIYEYPEGKADECAGRTLLKAFRDIDVQSNLLNSGQPLQDFPSPSIIIAVRPPDFLQPSSDPIRSTSEINVPPDLLSRTE